MGAMQRFEPYLQFASPEDEADYRKREAERRAYIDAELAKGTPTGDLNASAGAVGQMVDAKAHGAGDSPEFQQRWNELVATTEKLREEVRRSGGSTAEFDTRLREDLRRILKAKGLSDAQIDAQFAAHPEPLEAAKSFVNDNDMRSIEASRNVLVATAQSAEIAEAAHAPTAPVADNLDSAISELRAMGLVATDHDVATDPAHGVATAKVASTTLNLA